MGNMFLPKVVLRGLKLHPMQEFLSLRRMKWGLSVYTRQSDPSATPILGVPEGCSKRTTKQLLIPSLPCNAVTLVKMVLGTLNSRIVRLTMRVFRPQAKLLLLRLALP